jgi:uncharacterized membrane protein YedE/YeeE
MLHFTPIASTLGGMLIGLAAAVMWLANGRITGVSGILAGALTGPDRGWRGAFLLGLMAGPLLLVAIGFGPQPTITAGPARLVLAGLLVGFGTRLGGGCTSGHGVCGLARLSPRSLAATATFMAVAGLTVFVTRHVMGG